MCMRSAGLRYLALAAMRRHMEPFEMVLQHPPLVGPLLLRLLLHVCSLVVIRQNDHFVGFWIRGPRRVDAASTPLSLNSVPFCARPVQIRFLQHAVARVDGRGELHDAPLACVCGLLVLASTRGRGLVRQVYAVVVGQLHISPSEAAARIADLLGK